MLTMPLYGLLIHWICIYIWCLWGLNGYMHVGSLWGRIFSFDLQRSKSPVTRQIEATVAWNVMGTNKLIYGPTLTNGVKIKLLNVSDCICTVSYTLGMHIWCIWGLPFNLERSSSVCGLSFVIWPWNCRESCINKVNFEALWHPVIL